MLQSSCAMTATLCAALAFQTSAIHSDTDVTVRTKPGFQHNTEKKKSVLYQINVCFLSQSPFYHFLFLFSFFLFFFPSLFSTGIGNCQLSALVCLSKAKQMVMVAFQCNLLPPPHMSRLFLKVNMPASECQGFMLR